MKKSQPRKTAAKVKAAQAEEQIPEEEPSQFELGQVEKDCCK